MTDGNSKKSKLLWSKKMVRKWFNIRSKSEDSQTDEVVYTGGDRRGRTGFSEREPCTIKRSKTEKFTRNQEAVRRRMNLEHPRVIEVQNNSIFVATWNVGGRSPPSDMDLDSLLHASPPADIYVLGFQEIVPLNAGNILGAEDSGPAKQWLALIRRTLNSLPGTGGNSVCHAPSPAPKPIAEMDVDFEGSTRKNASSFFHRRSFQTANSWRMDDDSSTSQPRLDRRYSVCDRIISGHRPSDADLSLRWGHRPSDYSRSSSDYSRRSSDYGSRPSDYSMRPSDYNSRPSDYSRRSSECNSRPSDYSRRPSDYTCRPSDYFSMPSDYSRRSSDCNSRQSDYSRRPSDYTCRPSDYSSRPSDYSRRLSDYSRRLSDYTSRASDYSSRPSDYSRRLSDYSRRLSDYSRRNSFDEYNGIEYSPNTVLFPPVPYSAMAATEDGYQMPGHSRYSLVASKQMVGIFLTVWVRSELKEHVHNMKVSCVGRGLMGYLGNKGSISISLSLHQTSFCFVCSHLTSGQKEGDELRRNADVKDILKKTRFPRVNGADDEKSPQTILEHDRIIWLGDLNYRISVSYRSAKALVEMQNWRALLQNDQLRIEQKRGRVFRGWKEGKIYFPPTYKYSTNSDRYAGDDVKSKEKRRTPAWCDRILWYGQGLKQLSYVRGESRFSDHRPVHGIFWAEVESTQSRLKKSMSYSSSRIVADELWPYSHGYTELNFF